MEIKIWPEDPSKNLALKQISQWLNKKEFGKLLKKIKSYEKYPEENLYRSEIIKPIKGWHLKEIRIKSLRLLGDVISKVFWIFWVAQKKGNRLPKNDFEKAESIRNKFINEQNEHR